MLPIVLGEGWTPSKRLLLYEFDLSKGGLSLKLVLGPGEEALRHKLYSATTANPTVFNKANTKLYPKWWSCHSERWLTPARAEDLELSDLRALVTERFEQFLKERLPAMQSVIHQGVYA